MPSRLPPPGHDIFRLPTASCHSAPRRRTGHAAPYDQSAPRNRRPPGFDRRAGVAGRQKTTLRARFRQAESAGRGSIAPARMPADAQSRIEQVSLIIWTGASCARATWSSPQPPSDGSCARQRQNYWRLFQSLRRQGGTNNMKSCLFGADAMAGLVLFTNAIASRALAAPVLSRARWHRILITRIDRQKNATGRVLGIVHPSGHEVVRCDVFGSHSKT